GAIYVGGTGTIIDSNISNNFVTTYAGGGILVDAGADLTVSNTVFQGNSAGDFGGAIANFGTLNLSNSTTLVNNSAVSVGGFLWNDGTVTLSGDTLSSNSAGGGGAIWNGAALIGGTLMVDNSTFT